LPLISVNNAQTYTVSVNDLVIRVINNPTFDIKETTTLTQGHDYWSVAEYA